MARDESGEEAREARDPIGERGVLAKLVDVLSKEERRDLMFLAPAVVVMAVLDTVGLASIIPFLGLLSDPSAVEQHRVLSWAYETFAFASKESFFFAVGVGVLGVITTGNAFAALTTWQLLRFSWMRNHSLSLRLLDAYLARPYAYFLTTNTAELANKILTEVQQVVAGIVVQVVQLLARGVVVVFILIALVVMDPLMAIGTGTILGGLYGGLFYVVKGRVKQLGKKRLGANQARFKIASEMLTGIKEIKLGGFEKAMLARYAEPSSRFADAFSAAQALAQVPRYALETVAFGGILTMVLYLIRDGRGLVDVLPVIGLYAFAALKMLPGLQTVFAGLTNVRANLAALDAVLRDLPRDPSMLASAEPDVAALPYERETALSDVRFVYPRTEREVLAGIDLTIARGTWVAFVGPTGSGKSTLVDILLGLLVPTSGTVSVDGRALDAQNLRAWQQNLAYVPQQIFLADDTVARNICFGEPAAEIDMERVKRAAEVAQIAEFIERDLPKGYDTDVGERGIRLSGGQRQRLGIARALYRQPKLLVLDEATSALDGATEERFFTALRETHRHCTVISIAHRLTTTRDFDRILVLEKGRVVEEGRYTEMREKSAYFAASGA